MALACIHITAVNLLLEGAAPAAADQLVTDNITAYLITCLITGLVLLTPPRFALLEEHDKRADSIVKSMLQYFRGRSDERQFTDINALLSEDINLACHGMRAQDAGFNLTIETDLDPAVGKLNVIPQDVSRVFLNIITNGFYEVHLKKQEHNGEFKPTLTVKTRSLGDQIEIRIRDNGDGIPLAIREKLFTPFFTTKPPGKDTGLGLSISYDLIVHQHGGQLLFESEEGRYADVIIHLPN